MRAECPHCKKKNTKKNGKTSYGKQNHFCKDCGRQFVIGGQDWFISDAQKELVDKLLLERLSLAGICRVLGMSEPWLYDYLKTKYDDLPEDLNADLTLPDEEEYLADRFDEEIERIKKKRPSRSEKYVELNEEKQLGQEMDQFSSDLHDDLLINELYGKQRGARVLTIGLQLDEMWSFVEQKANKQWIWLALNPCNRQIVGLHVGSRGEKDARKFYESIPAVFRQSLGAFTDYWRAYGCVIDSEKHFAVGKRSGLTAYIERFNGTLRQRCSRLVRKALSFSKSFANHVGAIKYFICHYNLQRRAL